MEKSLNCLLVAAILSTSLSCGGQIKARPDGIVEKTAYQESGKERNVTLDDLPLPVKATIIREADGRDIVDLKEVVFSDRTVYEAEWVVGGKEVEIEIDSDGNILNRSSDDDVDHPPDDDDENGDDLEDE